MKHGDFTGLAQDYALHRPDYARAALDAVLGLARRPARELDAVDVGAGTGIWTRMLADAGLRSVTAVEPNRDMRAAGQADPSNGAIAWRDGKGESTGLAPASADLVTMASSFHWVDFEAGLAEFCRLLRPGGCFVALWNPRLIEANPLLVEIEAHLQQLKGEAITRVSSGRSAFTDSLTARLQDCGRFADVVYLEAQHRIAFTPERYLGAWRSVNDLRVQLGDIKFQQFLDWVARRIHDIASSGATIDATYLTRAWVARTPCRADA